jgi:glycosyltransferase involved in cell wall biosynthesis
MKLIAVMPCRSEAWILRASLEAALKWVDGIVLLDHASIDETPAIIKAAADAYPNRIFCVREDDPSWPEMTHRERLLEMAREAEATHIALIDADEILTANLLSSIRGWFEQLQPGQLIEVPMLAMRDLDHYQDDQSVWSGAMLTLGFCDSPNLNWKAAEDGYQHHSRPPYGCIGARYQPIRKKDEGGVMHLQFSNTLRLRAKHILYRMIDRLKWPERETVDHLNWKYDLALQPPTQLRTIPYSWWDGYHKELIDLNGVPWHEEEIRRLLREQGHGPFEGLDLKGFK